MPKETIKLGVEISDDLRQAIAMAVGSDKPASDDAIYNHFQLMVDQYALKITSSYLDFKASGGR